MDSESIAHNKAPNQPVAQPAWRRSVRRFALIFALSYIGIAVMMMALERYLVYLPVRYPHGYWNHNGTNIEEVNFNASDGTRLHGWFYPQEDATEVVMFAHGNGGNLTYWKEYIAELRARFEIAVFIFDYRGYGRSEGVPSEKGILDDARSARAWLADRASISEQKIVLMGQSLGGGVAVDLAARDGARALILDRAFDSLPDVAAVHYPWLPVRWLMRNRLDARAIIGNYGGPLLQIHGDVDHIVPRANGERLFEAAGEPKEFVCLPGLGHNDYPTEEFFRTLGRFFQSLSESE